MPVRPARREGRLPDRMTRLMLFLAHWMDYPPAGRGAYRRCHGGGQPRQLSHAARPAITIVGR